MLYNKYSDFLKHKYGEKVYKIPIHLNGTCPNRDGKRGTGGCIFCGEIGTGFEMQSHEMSIYEQLSKNMKYIGDKYAAKQFIAYFQNFTGTYLPLDAFKNAIEQVLIENVVGVSISTRPDCIEEAYLSYLKSVQDRGYDVEIELGLQSINPKTLEILNRGHSLKEYLTAVDKIHQYGFSVCTHLIGNLPWDSEEDFYNAAQLLSNQKVEGVKIHSLYILKDTVLGSWYESGQIKLIDSEQYIKRIIHFLRILSPEITVQRLFGRAPEEETLFCNWNTSWRKLQNQLEAEMTRNGWKQGDLF